MLFFLSIFFQNLSIRVKMCFWFLRMLSIKTFYITFIYFSTNIYFYTCLFSFCTLCIKCKETYKWPSSCNDESWKLENCVLRRRWCPHAICQSPHLASSQPRIFKHIHPMLKFHVWNVKVESCKWCYIIKYYFFFSKMSHAYLQYACNSCAYFHISATLYLSITW